MWDQSPLCRQASLPPHGGREGEVSPSPCPVPPVGRCAPSIISPPPSRKCLGECSSRSRRRRSKVLSAVQGPALGEGRRLSPSPCQQAGSPPRPSLPCGMRENLPGLPEVVSCLPAAQALPSCLLHHCLFTASLPACPFLLPPPPKYTTFRHQSSSLFFFS